MRNNKQRENEIKELLEQFSQCGGKTFDCPDPSVQIDKFEQESPLDFKSFAVNHKMHIKFLLNIRAKINFRIKIVEALLDKITNHSTNV